MTRPDTQGDENRQLAFSMALAVVLGLGGLLTLLIVLGALLAGLWLDNSLNTRPIFTILLMIISAPISIYVMYRLAMYGISKIAPSPKNSQEKSKPTYDD
jgi:F0F1-type ATP synthase assembly protein I